MSHLIHLLKGFVVAVICVAPLIAQEEGSQEEGESGGQAAVGAIIVRGAGEGGEFQTITAMEMPAPIAFSSGGGLATAFMGPWMSGIRSNSIDWVRNDDLLDELEIVAEQREKLRALLDDVQQRRQDFYKAFQEVALEKKGEFMREFSTLLTANVDDQVKEILLPHQLERFDQIRLQTNLRGSGLNVAYNSELAELLGVTDTQREEMRKKQVEVQKELQKKIELLRKEALDEVLSVLTPAQHKKLEKLMGKDYEFKPRSMFQGLVPRKKPDEKEEKD